MKKTLAILLSAIMVLSCLAGMFAVGAEETTTGEYVLSGEQLTNNPVLIQQTAASVDEDGIAVYTSDATANDPWIFWGDGVGVEVLKAPYAVVKYKANYAFETAEFRLTPKADSGVAGQGYVTAAIENTGLDAENWAYAFFDFSNDKPFIEITPEQYWCMRFDYAAAENCTIKIAEVRFFEDGAAAKALAGVTDEDPVDTPAEFDPSWKNVALGGNVTSSSNVYPAAWGWGYVGVVDGLTDATGASNKGWNVNGELPAWVAVELTSRTVVHAIKLYDLTGCYTPCSIPQTFTIEASDDNGETWVEIATEAGLTLTAGEPVEIILATPVIADTVRLTATGIGFTGNDGTDYTGISEIEVYGTKAPVKLDPAWTNVALSGSVTSSSNVYPAAWGWGYVGVVDGVTNATGASDKGWNVNGELPAWVAIEFAKRSTINVIKLYDLTGCYVPCSTPQEFTIEASDDGETWTEIANSEGLELVAGVATDIVLETPVTTKMIRLTATGIGFTADDGNNYTGLSEIEVYGVNLPAHTVTFVADEETIGTVEFTEGDTALAADAIPAVPAKDGFTGEWAPYTLGTEDITVNAEYTAITYTATFMADGQKIGEVTFTHGATALENVPAVPEKEGFTGAWGEYEMKNENFTVEAVYTENAASTTEATTTEATTTTEAATTTEAIETTTKVEDNEGCKSVVTGALVLLTTISLAGVALNKKH